MNDGYHPAPSATARLTPAGAVSIVCRAMMVAGMVLSSIGPSVVCADERLNEKYFEELRERRLFDVAEGFALHRLSEPDLPLRVRWDLARELARTFDEHARCTSDSEQHDLWQRARQVLEELQPHMAGETPQFVLEVELARLRLRQADFLLEELDLFSHDEALRHRVRQLVAGSNDELQKLYVRSERLLRRITALTRSSGDIRFTARELHATIYAVRFFRARALWHTLQLQRSAGDKLSVPPPATTKQEKDDDAVSKTLDTLLQETSPKNEERSGARPDRTEAVIVDVDDHLRRMNEFLKSIAEHDPPSGYTWSARLMMIEGRSLDAEIGEMERLIGAFAIRDLPPTVRADLEILRARYYVREQRFDQALQHILAYRKKQPILPGELFYWQQKSLAGLAKMAHEKKQPSLAQELLQESDTQARRAIDIVGGYWGGRCRIVAEQLHEALRFGNDLAQALQAARASHRDGDFAAANSFYRQALALAQESQHVDLEMETVLTLGGLLLQQQEFAVAASLLQGVAAAHSEHPEAARADLLHAYARGKLFEAEKTSALADAYAAALEHHRRAYGAGETADEATWMLAQLHERLGRPAEAIGLYAEVRSGHARRLDADVGIARSYENLLDALRERSDREAKQELEKRRGEAETTLLSTVQNYPQSGTDWNRQHAEVALRTARLLLNAQPSDYAEADRLLAQVLDAYQAAKSQADQLAAAEAETRQTLWAPILYAARQLRILSLAGQNQPHEAAMLVEQLADENPKEVLMVVLGISSITSESSPERRRQIGELQLSAAQLLQNRRGELSELDQARLDQCLAEAYAATDQPMKSLEVYESLLKRFPKDERLQKTTAELLVQCGTRDCLKRALTLWRRLEKAEPEGTAAWTEARYHIAWCHAQLKEYDEALKLLQVTRLLYPDLPPVWKEKLAALEKKCRGASRRK